jgi:hypothetical protein
MCFVLLGHAVQGEEREVELIGMRPCACAGGMLHAQAPVNYDPTMMAQPVRRHPSPEARGREPPPAWSQVGLCFNPSMSFASTRRHS